MEYHAELKALIIAILLTTGNREANNDRLVWASLRADDILRIAGVKIHG